MTNLPYDEYKPEILQNQLGITPLVGRDSPIPTIHQSTLSKPNRSANWAAGWPRNRIWV